MLNLDRIKKMDPVAQRTAAGVAILVVGAVVLHRARMRTMAEQLTLAYNVGIDEAFDNGVKYGLQMLKEAGIVQEVTEKAFG